MKPLLFLLACAICFSSCSKTPSIVVGSKNFTEQLILGEIAAQQLERKLQIKVERKLDLGGTMLAHGALLKGQIDLYPEYTGTASSGILKQAIPSDPAQAYIQVKDAYLQRFHLVWLPPLGFNDTFAMVVRKQDGQYLSPAALSSANKRGWRLGVGYEFLTRPDGLNSLNKTYALRWEGTPKTMDLGLLYQALNEGKIDMAAGNSTDGILAGQNFTILEDDKKAFPPYSACFVVRESLLHDRPEAGNALQLLSGHIDEQTMRSLNRRVDVDHRPIVQVAQEFLAGQP